MRTISLSLVLLAACSSAGTPATPATAPAAQEAFGAPDKVLFWTPAQQLAGYRNVEKIFPTRTVAAGEPASLPSNPKSLADVKYEVEGRTYDLEGFVAHNDIVGLLVIEDGEIAYERYERGNDHESRWISFSVTKSIVSLLIGAAIADGHIESVDDPVVRYLPQLAGTSYDGVTVEHVLRMASGVEWNEDYTDPSSDIGKTARFDADEHITYLATKPRVAEPGARFNYNTGETHLVGALLRAAIGGDLSTYLSKKIWKPYGMEADAVWPTLEVGGAEHGGCCLAATLRDYGRVGQFALDNGVLQDGTAVLPKDWIERSTTPSPGYDRYGYLWWLAGPTYSAAGIFGQSIWVNPKDRVVIVTHSMWPKATGAEFSAHRSGFFQAVSAALRGAE